MLVTFLCGIVDCRLAIKCRHFLFPFVSECRSVSNDRALLGISEYHLGKGKSTFARSVYEFDEALPEFVGRQVAGRGNLLTSSLTSWNLSTLGNFFPEKNSRITRQKSAVLFFLGVACIRTWCSQSWIPK